MGSRQGAVGSGESKAGKIPGSFNGKPKATFLKNSRLRLAVKQFIVPCFTMCCRSWDLDDIRRLLSLGNRLDVPLE